MRVLFVCDEDPEPGDTGYRQRIGAVLAGLQSVADVDVVLVSAQPGSGLASRVVTAQWRPSWERSVRAILTREPRWVAGRDWRRARESLRGAGAAYDLVWYEHGEVWIALAGAIGGPRAVVDLDNVLSIVLGRRAARERGLRAMGARVDAAAWARVEKASLRLADAVVVCSDSDRDRLAGGVVIPNGYDLARPVRRAPTQTLLLVASFDYPPNADAARWCAEEVLPLVRAELPDVRLRLVGRTGPGVEMLGRHPGVDVDGRVDDVIPELESAGVAVAPLRYGGGTRLKILEAFAARVPVVSTPVGVEGIDAQDGVHLLLAGDAAGLAGACVRLLTTPSLAGRLTSAAAELHAVRYTRSVTTAAAARLAQEVCLRPPARRCAEAPRLMFLPLDRSAFGGRFARRGPGTTGR